MTPYTEEVIRIIISIPAGKVMTYGQIAKLAGSPRSARQVVRIIHSMSNKYNLPWHRVINSKGEIGIPDEEGSTMQRLMLISEGVKVTENGFVDLEKFQCHTFDYKNTGD
jgi:methylated-DNA-protein-cysteine methyltransferase related protein